MSLHEKPTGIFESLLFEIQLLRNKVENLENLITPNIDLKKRSGVKKFLGISDGTLSNMMNDGRLKDGIHFTKEIKENTIRITYIDSAIRKLKEIT